MATTVRMSVKRDDATTERSMDKRRETQMWLTESPFIEACADLLFGPSI